MYLLGIDGGQTSTKSILYDPETGEFRQASGPPIDHMLTLNGQIKSRQGIQQSLHALLSGGVLARDVEMAFVSISGVHKEHEALIQGWISECLHVRRFAIEGDVKANLAGASAGANDGVLIIGGGGSIGYYFDGKREFVAGGYGHVLGDEGSAYWIGLQALKAGIRDSEGRGPATALRERILRHFGETSFWGIKKRIHADKLHRNDIADLSRMVEGVATEGDEVARQLLKQAGKELGELAVSVLKQASQDGNPALLRKVYPTGGVFQSAEWVLPSMKETLESFSPDVAVCRPSYPPIIGTLILAAQALNKTVNWDDFPLTESGG